MLSLRGIDFLQNAELASITSLCVFHFLKCNCQNVVRKYCLYISIAGIGSPNQSWTWIFGEGGQKMFTGYCAAEVTAQKDLMPYFYIHFSRAIWLFVGCITLLGFFNLVHLLHTKDGFVNVRLVVLQWMILFCFAVEPAGHRTTVGCFAMP